MYLKCTDRIVRRSNRPLLLLHPDDDFRNRVIKVGGTQFVCWSVSDWRMLRDAVRDAPPTAVVLVDPYLGTEDGAVAPELDLLIEEFPYASVVAAVRPRYPDGSVAALRELATRGISEVIFVGVEDTPPGLRRILNLAQGRFLKELLRRILPPYVTGRARVVLMAAAVALSAGGHAPDLARALAVSPKTLIRWCERVYLPPPRRVLAWIRVLLATELLDDPGRTVSGVARACGYTSDTALRRALVDFLNVGPNPLREAGALAVASRTFLRELARLRDEGRRHARARQARGRPA